MRASQPRLILILAFLAGCLLFLADMALPQLQFGILYLLCLLTVYLWGRRQDIYLVAALLSVLLLADLLLVDPPRNIVTLPAKPRSAAASAGETAVREDSRLCSLSSGPESWHLPDQLTSK